MSNKKNIHTISLLVANKPGVLVRIALVFARRGYNIDSLVVSPSYKPRFSRMTITAQGDLETLEQIIKQVNKLIDVIHAEEHTKLESVYKELAFIKVKFTSASKPIITKLAKSHKARIIDQTDDTLIIEQTGTTEELDEFESLLKKYNVLEMVRTGKLLMVRGDEET